MERLDSKPSTEPLAAGAERTERCGETLFAVFGMLDEAAIRYCVLQGYEGFPERTGSDIDCIIDAAIDPEVLIGLIRTNEARIGARVVNSSGLHVTLQCAGDDGMPGFLTFDFMTACTIDGAVLLEGERILRSRRRRQQFWIPSAGVEFHCYLAASIAKGRLDAGRTQRLSHLYRQAPEDCRSLLTEIWPADTAKDICDAAASADWGAAKLDPGSLRRDLRRQIIRRSPLAFLGGWMAIQGARLRRLCRPAGLNVVLLGPDGAGKSSVIDALEKAMDGPFARVQVRGFAPPLHRLWRRGPVKTDRPHALAPRSLPASIIRSAYWTLYNTAGHASVYWAKARSTLVLNDRHFIDILVDPVRYRYGGPRWLLQLIWWVMPKPDVIILLDAPPQVLQARKQELTLAETERQCRDYLALVEQQPAGRVVDAAQPFSLVMRDVCAIILDRREGPGRAAADR